MELNKIYNMDCLEGMKQLNNESVDLIVTDPPYNTKIDTTGGGGQRGSNRLNNFFKDTFTDKEYQDLINNSVNEMYRVLKQNKAIYLFINWKQLGKWLDSMGKIGFTIKNVIVWDKVVHGLNYHNYAYTYELIIYAVKGDFFPNNKSAFDKRKGFYKDIWHIQRNIDTNKESIHETVKQIDVIRTPILHASEENDLILDPFMGSGTTAVACQQLNRNFIGFEIEQKYIDLANKRLSQKGLRGFI